MTTASDGRVPLKAIALMIMAMVLVASSDAIGKQLTQTYSIWQVLWLRSWIWVAVVLIWVMQRGGISHALKTQTPFLQIARSLILVTEIAIFILAFRYLPLGDVTAIASAAPLVVLAFAVIFLGEKVGIHRWSAVAIGLIGMIMIARPGFGSFGWLTLLPIVGALLWGSYQVLVRYLSSQDSEETGLLWTGLTLYIVTGLVSPFFWQTPLSLLDWGMFFLAGLFNALGHLGLISAMHMAQASALQPFSYAQVVSAFAIGWLAFGEVPDFWTVCGLSAIVAGGLYAMYRERRLAERKTSGS